VELPAVFIELAAISVLLDDRFRWLAIASQMASASRLH